MNHVNWSSKKNVEPASFRDLGTTPAHAFSNKKDQPGLCLASNHKFLEIGRSLLQYVLITICPALIGEVAGFASHEEDYPNEELWTEKSLCLYVIFHSGEALFLLLEEFRGLPSGSEDERFVFWRRGRPIDGNWNTICSFSNSQYNTICDDVHLSYKKGKSRAGLERSEVRRHLPGVGNSHPLPTFLRQRQKKNITFIQMGIRSQERSF